jgi:hypothetical protein
MQNLVRFINMYFIYCAYGNTKWFPSTISLWSIFVVFCWNLLLIDRIVIIIAGKYHYKNNSIQIALHGHFCRRRTCFRPLYLPYLHQMCPIHLYDNSNYKSSIRQRQVKIKRHSVIINITVPPFETMVAVLIIK